MTFSNDDLFSYTFYRNGVEITEEGYIGDFDNGMAYPDEQDVIWAVSDFCQANGDTLYCVTFDYVTIKV